MRRARRSFEDVLSAAGQGTVLLINYRPEGLGPVDRLHLSGRASTPIPRSRPASEGERSVID